MDLSNQPYEKKRSIFIDWDSLFFYRDNVHVDIHTNEISENDENLIDSIQRVNIDDGELSTICKKNFPQQVDLNIYFNC
jgi:hypothetical protein